MKILYFLIGILLAIIVFNHPAKEMTIEEFSICMHYNPELTTLEELQDKCK